MEKNDKYAPLSEEELIKELREIFKKHDKEMNSKKQIRWEFITWHPQALEEFDKAMKAEFYRLYSKHNENE